MKISDLIQISLPTLAGIVVATATFIGSFLLYLNTTFIVKDDLDRLGDRIILETRTEMLLTRDILTRNLQRELLDTEFAISETQLTKRPQEHLQGKKREIEILLRKLDAELR
ncbi:MAG: hypothetical protein ACREAU_00940 [Nitrosopumilaceae archaeon]